MSNKKKKTRICGDCVHCNACSGINASNMTNTDATNCVSYEEVRDTVAYFLGGYEKEHGQISGEPYLILGIERLRGIVENYAVKGGGYGPGCACCVLKPKCEPCKRFNGVWDMEDDELIDAVLKIAGGAE